MYLFIIYESINVGPLDQIAEIPDRSTVGLGHTSQAQVR